MLIQIQDSVFPRRFALQLFFGLKAKRIRSGFFVSRAYLFIAKVDEWQWSVAVRQGLSRSTWNAGNCADVFCEWLGLQGR